MSGTQYGPEKFLTKLLTIKGILSTIIRPWWWWSDRFIII